MIDPPPPLHSSAVVSLPILDGYTKEGNNSEELYHLLATAEGLTYTYLSHRFNVDQYHWCPATLTVIVGEITSSIK